MLGLGLQATLNNQGSGQIHPVQDGLVLADNFRLSPVNDNLGLEFPSNGSAVFNGSSDYVSIPNLGITGGQARTITAWVYNSGNGTIVNLGNDATGEKYAFRIILNDLRIEIAGAGYTSSLVLTSNKWHHVAVTQSGANLNTAVLYLDGSSENSTTSATANTNENGNNLIGKQITGDYFNGNLANVAIWNRALSSDEINSVMWKDYSQVTNSERVGLQAWYALSSKPVTAEYYTRYVESNGGTVEDQAYLQQQLNALSL